MLSNAAFALYSIGAKRLLAEREARSTYATLTILSCLVLAPVAGLMEWTGAGASRLAAANLEPAHTGWPLVALLVITGLLQYLSNEIVSARDGREAAPQPSRIPALAHPSPRASQPSRIPALAHPSPRGLPPRHALAAAVLRRAASDPIFPTLALSARPPPASSDPNAPTSRRPAVALPSPHNTPRCRPAVAP